MKHRILFFTIFIFCTLVNADENVIATKNGVSFNYIPDFSNGISSDCDLEDGLPVKTLYINVPEGEVRLHVGDSEWIQYDNEYKGKTIEKLYESSFEYAARQRVLKIRIFPFKRQSGKIFVLKKISINVEFQNALYLSKKYNPISLTSINNGFESPLKSQIAVEDIPFKSYLEIKVKENGIYRIEYQDIVDAGIDPKNISLRNFGLYSNSGVNLPVDTVEFMKYLTPEKTPYIVRGNNDDLFEKGEYILFFGESPYGDSINFYGNYDLYNNPFSDYKHYMLVFNDKTPLRAQNLVFSFETDTEALYSECVMHFDSINPLLSGYGWTWKKFNMMKDSGDAVYEFSFESKSILDSAGEMRLSFFYQTDVNDTYEMELYLNEKYIGTMANRGAFNYIPKAFSFSVSNLSFNNTVRLVGKNTDNKNKVFYLSECRTKYKADKNNPDDIIIKKRDSRYLSIEPEKELYAFIKSNSVYCIGEIEKGKAVSLDLLTGEKAFLTDRVKEPESIKWSDNNVLYNEYEGCDILVITGNGYKTTLIPYIQYRKSQGLKVKVVEIGEIADAFAFGIESPAAIKAYIHYAFNNWQNFPKYLLLLGSGSYDYKNRQNIYEDRNVVPLYETGYGVFEQALLSASRSQCVDRWYTLISGDDQYMDIIPGRITVLDKNEAHLAMMKIIDCETKMPARIKNKVMVISDDEYSSRAESYYHDIGFMYDSENLAGLLGIYFGVNKLYLTDYMGSLQTSEHWDANPGFKRDVRYAFRDILNKGVAFGFFYGHGSYYTLTHEHILLYPDDIDLFTNLYKYPVFLFGTCQAGQFDNDFGSIAAEFQKLPYSGFSASIASTRAIGSDESINILHNFFATDLISGGFATIGEYYLSMINTHSYTSTSHVLFGDPSMRIKKYKYDISILSEDTISLGSFNEFSYSTSKDSEGEIIFDIYQPFYSDSHDYWHILPYSYIYYSKSDGIMNRVSLSESAGSFTSFLPDSFAEKKYLNKMLISGVYEDDSLIHLGVRKPILSYAKESVNSSGEIKFFMNNIELKDSATLKTDYEIEVRFYSETGVYLGNVSQYQPSVTVRGDADLTFDDRTFESKEDYFANLYDISSLQKRDTINAVIFDGKLNQNKKTLIVKHNTKLKTEAEFTLYPNPFTEYFFVTFNSANSGLLRWKMIDEKGFTVSSGEEPFIGGFNSVKIIPAGQLMNIDIMKGIYYFTADFIYYGKNEPAREKRKVVKK